MQPQSGKLACFELEHEVARKAIPVAIHLLVKALYRDSINLGQGLIENDFLLSQNRDSGFNRNQGSLALSCQGVHYYEAFCRAQLHSVIVHTNDNW